MSDFGPNPFHNQLPTITPVQPSFFGGGLGTAGGNIPAGAIVMYGASAAPSGWLLCDGSSVLRATYPDLFTAIGTAYGSVDGTHFNVPDFRDTFAKGKGGASSLGGTGGSSTHTHNSHTTDTATFTGSATTYLTGPTTHSSVNTEPPYLIVNFIIKT